jgi:branched-chain amino acid transport system permease protein
LLAALALVRAAMRSPIAAVLAAIAENPSRSAAIGLNVTAYRLAAIAFSAALTGFSGALSALHDGALGIASLGVDRSASLVVYAVVGGVQSVLGPVAGTAAMMWLENALSANAAAWHVAEAAVFVAAILWLPGGIAGALRARRRAPEIMTEALAVP